MCLYLGSQLFNKRHTTQASNFPFISNLYSTGCASKQDVLVHTTLRYVLFNFLESQLLAVPNMYVHFTHRDKSPQDLFAMTAAQGRFKMQQTIIS